MFQIDNLYNNTNANMIYSNDKAGLVILEMKKDLSVDKSSAANEYFASEMNVRKRQVVIDLQNNVWTVSAGAMQVMLGDVRQILG